MSQNEGMLNRRLSEFRKKYYTDKILRGSLILALLVSSMLFMVLLSEGVFGFNSGARTGIVYGLGAVIVGVLGYMILWPLLQLASLTRGISDFQIADLVSKHFPSINDKLKNLLQLKEQQDDQNSLLAAAIDKKSEEIVPVPLSSAINLNVNLKYLKYLIVPFLLLLAYYMFDPQMFSASSHHLINFKEDFAPPPPFAIEVSDLPTKIIAGEDYPLSVNVDGNELPSDLYIYMRKESEGQFIDYSLNKASNTEFNYTLSDVKEDFTFFIGNPDVRSGEFNVEVLKRPYIKNFNVFINYPAYTGLGSEKLEDNVGDFKVIKGSTVTWKLKPQGEIDQAFFVAKKQASFKKKEDKEEFSYSRRMMDNVRYFISLESKDKINNIDTVKYNVDILQDRYPSVYVFTPNSDFVIDLDPTMPLELEIADDFGFSKMSMFYRFTKSGGTSEVDGGYKEFPMTIEKRTLLQPLDYLMDLTELGLKEGDEIEYYLEVWDNDGVSGPKSSTSATYKVVYPTLDAKYDEIGEQKEEVKSDIEQMKQKAEDLKESYRKMQEKLLDQKKLSFDDKKEIQRMLEEHQDMLDQLSEMQEKFEENKEELEKNQMISEETLKMYEELNEYLEELENPEIEKLLQELAEKLEELNPEDIKQKLEDLEMNDEEMQKSMERTMELLKQLEVNEKIDEIRNKLEKLEAKQEMLNEQLENAEDQEDMEKLSDRQEELDKQMDGIKEDLEDLKEMKDDTETPDSEKMEELEKDAEEAQEEMKEASEEMDEAGEKMEQGKKKDSKSSKQSASDKQKKAKKKLKKMSEELSSMQFEMQMMQDQQNLENLRELLENLLKLSFDQEDLRDEVKSLKYGDPALKDKSRNQKKLQDDMELVKDSLDALADKVFQIKKFVMDESKKITENMQQSQSFFRNKQIPMITYHQQMSMTSINNLANMLSEVMQQIQEQMKNSMPGNGMCNKPGQGMSMQKLGEKQKGLNGELQKMMNMGGSNPDKLAKMAAQQEAIRQQLNEMHNKIKKGEGKALGDMDKIMGDMIQSETELLNKQLTHETLMRQQEILSRLLQADKSVREREYEEKRESKTARFKSQKSPEELSKEEYKNKIRQELLKSNKLEYSNDFIILIEQYFKKLEEGNE